MDKNIEILRSSPLRVSRAKEIRKEMFELIQQHHSNPVRLEFEITDEWTYIWAVANEIPPLEVTIRFGEWLYQLRAALDSMLYDLAIYATGQNPPTGYGNRQFPILGDATDKTTSRWKKAVAGLEPWMKEYIDNMQPYNSIEKTKGLKGNALWWLNELARIDRHRSVHAFCWKITSCFIDAVKKVTPDAEIELLVSDPTKVTVEPNNPVKIARVESQKIEAHIAIESKPDVRDWVHKSPSSYVEYDLTTRMEMLEEYVAKSIKIFDNEIQTKG